MVEPGQDLLGRQGAHVGGGQFEGERDAVEAFAEPVHGLQVRGGELPVVGDGGGAVGEQPGRLRQLGLVLGGGRRAGQRADAEDVLAGDVQRDAGGGQDGQPGGGAQQVLGEVGAGVDQVLAGVEDQE
ncbi:hypothetical protein ACIBEJ_08135 [Nonomuraea sp. NPDC050790]|uniref:hypothetical protein n=1 Tax=Nonomuraea sp. NPDC050790 TaxID=3364371 RepID=UPI00379D67BE